MSTAHRESTQAETNVGFLPRRDTRTGVTHSADDGANQPLEQAIHDTFELPGEFTLEELAALVRFVLCRGARLRLARHGFSVDQDDEFVWVQRSQTGDQPTSLAPQTDSPHVRPN